MSFLNSVLSSIGGGGEYVPPSTPRTPISSISTSASQPPPSISTRSGLTPTSGRISSGQKRKAEEQLSRPYEKTARRDIATLTATHGNPSANKPPPQTTPNRPTVTTASVSYRGTAKPINASPIPATASAKAAPKKGSYAEILARAKAAQTASAHVGVIKHKPKETLSKKEKLALQAEASGKSKGGLNNAAVNGHKSTPDSKGSSPAPSTAAARNRGNTAMKSKKAVEVGYKGTARPLPETSYKGTMNRTSTAVSSVRKKEVDDRVHNRSRSTSVTRPVSESRYAGYSDEEEEEEEEEADYESDLSDMEAGAFDVEEEEQRSSKVARKEDEEELRKESEAKKQKDAMRKKLTQMAAAKRRR
ncbi:MAG: hypothetical protein M1830_009542 [Pleopsidium flavum]|nr:MAG: hypothetical protein M1830_009542 [Pleopsidium flavum]